MYWTQIYIKYGIELKYTRWQNNTIVKFVEEKQNQIIPSLLDQMSI